MKIVMQPIDMIVHFYSEGLPRPMRFRMKDDSGEYIAIDIDKVLTKSEEKIGQDRWLLYSCECIVEGQKRQADFKFDRSSCRWFLYKFY